MNTNAGIPSIMNEYTPPEPDTQILLVWGYVPLGWVSIHPEAVRQSYRSPIVYDVTDD